MCYFIWRMSLYGFSVISSDSKVAVQQSPEVNRNFALDHEVTIYSSVVEGEVCTFPSATDTVEQIGAGRSLHCNPQFLFFDLDIIHCFKYHIFLCTLFF